MLILCMPKVKEFALGECGFGIVLQEPLTHHLCKLSFALQAKWEQNLPSQQALLSLTTVSRLFTLGISISVET